MSQISTNDLDKLSLTNTAIDKDRLSDRVYDALLEQMHHRKLLPGQEVNRRRVAAALGISVAPVLEAMVQLEHEGFLASRPRRGTYVKPIDPQEVRGRFILRIALEAQAARMYCGEPIIKHEKQLLKLAKQVDQTPPHDPRNWRAEVAFHTELVKLAQCQVLIKEFETVMHHGLFYAVNEIASTRPRQSPKDCHQGLVEALKTVDPGRADGVIRYELESRLDQAL